MLHCSIHSVRCKDIAQTGFHMNERKTEAINLRMAPGMKELLRRAAEYEHRTLSNMLEVLILDYCRAHNLMDAPGSATLGDEKRDQSSPSKKS